MIDPLSIHRARQTTRRHFLNQTGAKMRFRAFVDAFIKVFTWRIERQNTQAARAFVWLRALGLLVHNRASRLQVYLDRTLHARPVTRVKLPGSEWIDTAEELVQVFGPTCLANLIETATQTFVSWWTDEEWVS